MQLASRTLAAYNQNSDKDCSYYVEQVFNAATTVETCNSWDFADLT